MKQQAGAASPSRAHFMPARSAADRAGGYQMRGMRGLFITLEGIDGSGKSTQACLLAGWLRQAGHCVRLTREPGGTETGEAIREMVLSADRSISPEAELFLYLADRAVHVAEVVSPALDQGSTVLCERYTDSTLAYQGYGRGLDIDLLRRLNAMATGGLAPDLTLVLDLPPEQARLDADRLDRLESEGRSFTQRVAEGFRALARSEPARIKLVDAGPGVEVVHAAMVELVQEFMGTGRAHPARG
jgi:dTMP kinase